MLCVVLSPTIQSYHPLQYYHMIVETSLSLCQVIIPPGLSIPIHLIYLPSTNFLPQITLGEDRSYTSHADNRGEECRTLRLHHKIPSRYGSRLPCWAFYIFSARHGINEVALQPQVHLLGLIESFDTGQRIEVRDHNFPI